MKRLHCFPRISGLNLIFHTYVYSEISFNSSLSSSVAIIFAAEKVNVFSVNSFTFEFNMLRRSFLYIKNSNGL